MTWVERSGTRTVPFWIYLCRENVSDLSYGQTIRGTRSNAFQSSFALRELGKRQRSCASTITTERPSALTVWIRHFAPPTSM